MDGKDDVYCIDVHKYFPHETILAAVQQVDQPKVKEDIQHPCEYLGEKEANYCVMKIKQKVLSPLSEDEIDQLLKSHITVQAKEGLHFSHSQESVSKTSPTFENENLSLNEDNPETRFIDHHEKMQSPFSMFIF